MIDELQFVAGQMCYLYQHHHLSATKIVPKYFNNTERAMRKSPKETTRLITKFVSQYFKISLNIAIVLF